MAGSRIFVLPTFPHLRQRWSGLPWICLFRLNSNEIQLRASDMKNYNSKGHRVRVIKADIAQVDACILMFKPDYDPDTIKPKTTLGKSPAMLPKRAGSRTARVILRQTGEALSSIELARRIMERLGKEPDPQAAEKSPGEL
jgi:hypothetical protein